MQALLTFIFSALAARFQSKTYIFALLLMVFGVVQQLAPMLQSRVDPATFGTIMAVIGTIVAALREVTTVPLSAKGRSTTSDATAAPVTENPAVPEPDQPGG